jgi:hypothetical protein
MKKTIFLKNQCAHLGAENLPKKEETCNKNMKKEQSGLFWFLISSPTYQEREH